MNYLEAIKEYTREIDKDDKDRFGDMLQNNTNFSNLWQKFQYEYADFLIKKIHTHGYHSWFLSFMKLMISIKIQGSCYAKFLKTSASPYTQFHDECADTCFSRIYYEGTPYDIMLYYDNLVKDEAKKGRNYGISDSVKNYHRFLKNEKILINLMLTYRWYCLTKW